MNGFGGVTDTMNAEAGWTVAGGHRVTGGFWRKVRTPLGGMLANGQAQQAERPKATESGTENKPPKTNEAFAYSVIAQAVATVMHASRAVRQG